MVNAWRRHHCLRLLRKSYGKKLKTKKINNRTIIGIVCIVLALVVTFGVSPLVNRISDQKTDIVRVKNTIERGQQITANDLEIVRVGSYNLPDGVIKDGKSVVGKYATATLFAGDYLFSEKITGESNSAADILEYRVLYRYKIKRNLYHGGKFTIEGEFVKENTMSEDLREKLLRGGVPGPLLERFMGKEMIA